MKPAETIAAFVELFNLADANGLADLYHEDAVNYQVPNETYCGKGCNSKRCSKKEFAAAKNGFALSKNIFQDGEWGYPGMEKIRWGLRGLWIFFM